MSETSPPDVVSERSFASQFVGFQIDSQQYAIRIEQIQEIVILESVTPMPQVAGFCEGVSNLRGAIIPIINLRALLGISPKPTDQETRTIVVNVGERTIGCTVDAVSQVIRIPEESIQPAPETITGGDSNAVSGFAKLNDQLIILLDIDELLSPIRLKSFPSEEPGAATKSVS